MEKPFEPMWKNLKEVPKREPFQDMAIAAAEVVARDPELPIEKKRYLLEIVRAWSEYAEENLVLPGDHDLIRWHLDQFAQRYFGPEHAEVPEVLESSIDGLTVPTGESFSEYVNTLAGENIVDNPGRGVYGGVSRLALRMLAASSEGAADESYEGVNVDFPPSDLDIIRTKEDVQRQSGLLGAAELVGTKIVPDFPGSIPGLLAEVDFSINQSVVHEGKLFYTEQALEDIRTGTLRFSDKKNGLFSAGTETLPDGRQFVNRVGLYRAFSFLLRGKARQLPIHTDNLSYEAPLLGRYWLIILYLKLYPIKDEARRETAVSGWFNLAKRLRVTDKETPDDFLMELDTEYPEMRSLLKPKQEQLSHEEMEAQARYLAGKLINRSVDSVLTPDAKNSLPGMSDEMTVIDRDFIWSERHDVGKALSSIESMRDSVPGNG